MRKQLLKIIIISRSFGRLERRLLIHNCNRARNIFGDVSIAYVLGERELYDADPLIDSSISFYLVKNHEFEKNAALSRGIGYSAIKATSDDLVIFLDGDMLIRESYLVFLKNQYLYNSRFLAISSRIDIRYGSNHLQRRRVQFKKDKKSRFVTLYGCIAIRGIDFDKHNIMTHDTEEQWFLRSLNSNDAQHILYSSIGIFHFDRFSGNRRILRYFTSSRGVGVWQGIFRDKSLTRIISDAGFLINQRKSILALLKLLMSAVVALPKLLLFRVPRQLLYQEIKGDDA